MAAPTSNACLYAQMLPALREAARKCGYALALHGSVVRDLDLIAVPWTPEAASNEDLVAALFEIAGGYYPEGFAPGVTNDMSWVLAAAVIKPHGRRAWSISFGGHVFIDLGVMPLVGPPPGP